MFDIGFAELILISVVALLVIGPERLPGAIRTGSLWLSKLKRGFNDIKREVQQELHNDGVMQELRKTGDDSIQQDLKDAAESAIQSAVPDAATGDKTENTVEKKNT